jgi:hypothetical protein
MNDNVVFDKIYKNDNCNILLINYQFLDKLVSGRYLGPKIKDYYEKNSRSYVKITLTYYTVQIQAKFNKIKSDDAVNMTRKLVANKFGANRFDFLIHFCNPKISHTGQKNAVTFASYVNTIHETGHLFGFGHANTRKYDSSGNFILLRCRDPFDPMTVFMSYPSLNPVHRHSHGWYLPGEIVYLHIGSTYNMAMLKDLDNQVNIKTLYYTYLKDNYRNNYWITYGTLNGAPKIIVHTSDPGMQYSYLDAIYPVGKLVVHKRSGLTINSTVNQNSKFVTVTIGSSDQAQPLVQGQPEALAARKVTKKVQEPTATEPTTDITQPKVDTTQSTTSTTDDQVLVINYVEPVDNTDPDNEIDLIDDLDLDQDYHDCSIEVLDSLNDIQKDDNSDQVIF